MRKPLGACSRMTKGDSLDMNDEMSVCPQCQAERGESDQICPNCGYRFVDQKARRPGFVTAYVILSCLLATIGSIYGIASSVEVMGIVPSTGWFLIPIWIGTVILYWVAGIGLWKLKNWARILTIVIHALGLLSVCSRFNAIIRLSTTFYRGGYDDRLWLAILGLVVNLLVRGYVVYWFLGHRELFERKLSG